ASQAPERTAASGWAGLGVYGVSCQPTPPRHPTECLLLLLLLLLLRPRQVQGCKPCQTNPLISRQSAIPLGEAARAGAALHMEPYR
ncbi:hypothetical protein, partial [Stenotrophomonas maltophilia]|uniref:hypothetical protein n=1 Tax=Stenotrophomonas maltophilia TaxID=40324 RepID=UPI001E4EFEA9